MEMGKEVIETRNHKVWREDNGIVRVLPAAGTETTLDEAKGALAAQSKVGGDKSRPTLADIRKLKGITREAREYLSGKDAQETMSALAILIGSPVSRVIGNFFLGLNKPSFPTRLFTSEEEAVKWLKGFIA